MSRPARLAAKVKAVNRVHAEAMRIYALLVPYFTPLVGQKIEKQDGDLLHKIAKDLPELPNGNGHLGTIQVYRHRSNYSLAWGIRTSENVADEHGCLYHETIVYIGEMTNGVLAKISQAPQYRTNFTTDEISGKRARLKAAKEQVSQIEGTLHPFGESDS